MLFGRFRVSTNGISPAERIVAFAVFHLVAVLATANPLLLWLDKPQASPYNMLAFVGNL
jgi:hypothetical protein